MEIRELRVVKLFMKFIRGMGGVDCVVKCFMTGEGVKGWGGEVSDFFSH